MKLIFSAAGAAGVLLWVICVFDLRLYFALAAK